MKYTFLAIVSLFFLKCYSQDIEPSCADPFIEFPVYELDTNYKENILELFLSKPENIQVVDWEWEELGPLGTPGEGGISKALPKNSLERGNGTGRINNLYVNPNKEEQIFACSPTGGLFYSVNYGESWRSGGTDQLPISGVSSITVNPLDFKNWIISTGDGDDQFMFSTGIYRTYDEGVNWEKINGKFNAELPIRENTFDFYISELVSHPCDFNKQFLATNRGLYKCGNAESESEKIKWRQVSSNRFYDIEISSLNESIIAAGGEDLWLSFNCGKTWKNMGRPDLEDNLSFGLHRMSVELSREDSTLIYIGYTRKKALGKGQIASGKMYQYHIQEESWEEISSLEKFGNLIPTRARAFEISPWSDSLFLIGNVKPVRRSIDKGITFKSIENNQMHDDVHDFEFLSDGNTVFACHDGGVSYSTDSGITWSKRDRGIGAANVHGISVGQTDDDIVLYGGYDTGCTLLKKGRWTHVSFGDGFETVINKDDSSRMIITMQNGRIYADTTGNSEFNNPIRMKSFKTSWHTWVQPNPAYANVLYKSGKQVARSLDFGETWEIILDSKNDLGVEGSVWRVYLTDGFPDVLYAVVLGANRSEDRIYFSTNPNEKDPAMIHWKVIPKCPKNGWIESILKTDHCETCHVISFNSFSKGEKVYQFDGTSYHDISYDLGYSSIRSGIRDKNTGRIYLGTKEGLFTKSLDNDKWKLLTGLPGARIRSLAINYTTNEIYVGTFGRGVWKGSLIR